jgi:hypothetical protein
VARIGGAMAVNGFLNGAITKGKGGGGQEMRLSKGRGA